ncbi:hypothetical protein CIPAW_10G160600 [Carya illinoinensis]|uniref:Uncharacterized protein n=1 Tax=Carya illinoinensis TaxID=32201 RepID=A0A8T1PGN4_CARIL|nr:hypothetical protein CIPAW_10G160600 [Carya illinoinensis]
MIRVKATNNNGHQLSISCLAAQSHQTIDMGIDPYIITYCILTGTKCSNVPQKTKTKPKLKRIEKQNQNQKQKYTLNSIKHYGTRRTKIIVFLSKLNWLRQNIHKQARSPDHFCRMSISITELLLLLLPLLLYLNKSNYVKPP